MSAKFIHRRYIIKTEDKSKLFVPSCKGGTTVGYIWDKDHHCIKLAVARCSEEDNFNRKVARDIVLGRLASKRPNRNHTIDLKGVTLLTPQAIEDIVWGWLENQERLWDARPVSHKVH